MIPCTICGKEAVINTYYRKSIFKKHGIAYCSDEWVKIKMSRVMSETNRKYASERMKKNNPMKRESVRKKQKAALRRIKHRPPTRGGNGRPATDAEVMLHKMLHPMGFKLQTIVKTGGPHPPGGYPNHYKIDCGNKRLKIAIEADGYSHNSLSRQAQDKKKEDFLRKNGWSVFRFRNEEILGDPDTVVETILSEIGDQPCR
jgi:hypothetical protein